MMVDSESGGCLDLHMLDRTFEISRERASVEERQPSSNSQLPLLQTSDTSHKLDYSYLVAHSQEFRAVGTSLP